MKKIVIAGGIVIILLAGSLFFVSRSQKIETKKVPQDTIATPTPTKQLLIEASNDQHAYYNENESVAISWTNIDHAKGYSVTFQECQSIEIYDQCVDIYTDSSTTNNYTISVPMLKEKLSFKTGIIRWYVSPQMKDGVQTSVKSKLQYFTIAMDNTKIQSSTPEPVLSDSPFSQEDIEYYKSLQK